MGKFLRKVKKKLLKFWKTKTVWGRVAELEKRAKSLEKKNMELKNEIQLLKANQKKAIKRVLREEAEQQKELELMIERISAKTGWKKDYIDAKYRDARKRTGCMPKEFNLYRMYEMTDEEQETVLVASIQKHLRKEYDVNKDFVKVLCNKELTNKFFEKYVRRPWCVNTKISWDDFVNIFKNTNRVIYKPLSGNRGKGVEAFDLNADRMNEVYDVLKTYPIGVVEEYVVQHPEMLRLCPSSVNTIRVVTFSSNTKPVTKDGKMWDIAYSSLRIGGGSSIVDNFHSGGMVSNIDLDTGKLITNAADMECNVFTHHPVTGVEIKGFKIPYFKETLEMVKEAVTENKLEGYLGWDIAIAEHGPILIEVNAQPGIVLLSTPYAEQKKGMKYVLAKYLS